VAALDVGGQVVEGQLFGTSAVGVVPKVTRVAGHEEGIVIVIPVLGRSEN
jgi:hypothetical protein